MLTIRHKSYLLILFCPVVMLSVSSCGERENSEENTQKNNTAIIGDSRLLLQTVKASLDATFNSPKSRVTVFVRTPKKELFEVKNKKLPKEIETTFNLLKDSTGRLLVFKEIPFIKTGDHHIEVIHYFGEDGKTFAVTLVDNFFNKQGAANWARTTYYNSNFKEISRSETLSNEKNQPLKSEDGYAFPYAESFHSNSRLCEKELDPMKKVSLTNTVLPATEFTPQEAISYLNKSYEEVNSVITKKGYVFSDLLNNLYEYNKIKGGIKYKLTLVIKNNRVSTISTNEIYNYYPVVLQSIQEEGFSFNQRSHITLPSGKTTELEEAPAKPIASSTVRFDKDTEYSCFIVCSNSSGNNTGLISVKYGIYSN